MYVINSICLQYNILRVTHLDAGKDIIVNNIILWYINIAIHYYKVMEIQSVLSSKRSLCIG